jgi:hypothetical protein
MRPRIAAWALLSLLCTGPAGAQSLYGEADWMLYRARTTFGGTRGFTKLFTQSYMVGYESILWDPRLGNYLAELTFLRSDIRNNDLDGDSKNLGYNLGATLFPNRPFPFSISATRAAGDTSPQFPGFDFATGGAGGVALPPGYVPDRYSTRLHTLDVNSQLILPAWPKLYLDYRKDSGRTATGPYEGTEKNGFLNVGLEKEWRGARNQLSYTDYSGESRSGFPLDREQKELLYNLSADLTTKLRADGRAGFRDISSTFTLASAISSPTGQVPPILSNDLTSYYSNGGLTYQQSERLGFDGLVGYEQLQFDRDGRDASSDSLYTIGSVRYRLFDALNLAGNVDSSRRSETLDAVRREGTQRGVGGSFSYAPTFGIVHPVVGGGRSVGRISTLDGLTGDTAGWSRQVGLSVTPGQWLVASGDYLDAEATDDIFVLGNFTRRRWQVNASSRPAERLRLDGNWERTNLDQGLGEERLRSDYRLGQAGAAWDLRRYQTLGARFGTWRTESGSTVVDTIYAVAVYRAALRAMQIQAELVRDSVRTQSLVTGESPERILYRIQGLVEYRLRLFTFGFNYRYSNNVETGLARYLNNEWSIRIGRRFGAAFVR